MPVLLEINLTVEFSKLKNVRSHLNTVLKTVVSIGYHKRLVTIRINHW